MTFKLKSPNDELAIVGAFLLVVSFVSISTKSFSILVGLGFLVKILVLVWIPKAAKIVGRNKFGWTIFTFFIPSLALIILGKIGYKTNPHKNEIILNCKESLQNKITELKTKNESGELTDLECQSMTEHYLNHLQNKAKEYLTNLYDTPTVGDDAYLNKKLDKKGFVFNDSSDVFVDYNLKCPACDSVLTTSDSECPECRLVLRNK